MRAAECCAIETANLFQAGNPVLLEYATGLSKTSLLRLHANELSVISFRFHSTVTLLWPISFLSSANSPVRRLSVAALKRRARCLLNPYTGSPCRRRTRRRTDGLNARRGRASYLLNPYARHPYRQYEWPEEGLFSIDKIYSPDLANKYQAACNVMPTTGPHRSTKRPSGAAGVTTLRGLGLHDTNECDVIRESHDSET